MTDKDVLKGYRLKQAEETLLEVSHRRGDEPMIQSFHFVGCQRSPNRPIHRHPGSVQVFPVRVGCF